MMRHALPLLTLLGLLWACGPGPDEAPSPDRAPPSAAATTAAPPPDPCPAEAQAPTPLPGASADHQRLAYWLEVLGKRHDLDAVLLDPAGVRRLNAAAAARPHGPSKRVEESLAVPVDADALVGKLRDRLAWMKAQIDEGKYVARDGRRLTAAEAALYAVPAGWRPRRPELRAALAATPLRCGPAAGSVYKGPTPDPAFDRNNCSTIHGQEPVEVLGPWPGGRLVVRTRYALGWINADAPLSPPLGAEGAAFLAAERAHLTQAVTLAGTPIAAGRQVAVQGDKAWVATARGLQLVPKPAGASPTARPLTRRAMLETAFGWLDTPYGWGGQAGGRDCSRLLLDLFGSFGVELPRYSGHQPHVASFVLDVAKVEDEGAKQRLIDAAQARGVVLLHFPGHIMLYLGRDAAGTPMALHSFAEYLEPCPADVTTHNPKRETLRRVHKVTVSDLELGRGTSRRAFIERITHIAVLGGDPGPGLAGLATERPAAPVEVPARCRRGGRDFPTLVGPATPHDGQPLRLVAAPMAPPGPVELLLVDPTGEAHRPALHRMPGPPYTLSATMPAPMAGRWTAVWGDGDRVLHCQRVRVVRRPERRPLPPKGIWEVRTQWGPQTEALFSAFVARLFDYPVDDDRTWTNLHTLLQDQERNLLFGHLGQGEDATLRLQPDCADLPYYLRAYYAWKMGLPFGFRSCSRGRRGRPPKCGDLMSHTKPPRSSDPVRAAAAFIRRDVKSAVHSSTARTRPQAEAADTYPLPMTREAIRPGVTFADPYGHLLVVAGWVPQGATEPGLLIAADAQPDGTIGRRRFWQGSFLFTPETKSVGAGFKGWRPVYAEKDGTVVARDNAYLAKTRNFPPYSEAQYAGSAADFYDRMEALMNPRPLDPFARQTALVEALHEVVKRRVLAVNNGEAFMRSRGFRPIKMPSGANIFLTAGPWEDFSTPSRDLRLLISIHTVLDYAASVRRSPERFGLSADEASAVADQVAAARDAALGERTIEYTNSAGQAVPLTLAQVVARREALEMAYNPNDCVETRWAAPAGSPEAATCQRTAAAAQRKKMRRYRPWFAERRRPAR